MSRNTAVRITRKHPATGFTETIWHTGPGPLGKGWRRVKGTEVDVQTGATPRKKFTY
jgi:hypothetical protein